ncbi:MAG: YihY/virulence factor BrkB family protein [Hyphomicrobiaceae bacterium]|nr:YihY/virulence factor BrkB family protein [Hyphomicrobiaceae bacterium]
MRLLRAYKDTILRLYNDLGLALAGAVTFSGVLALFPFLIFVTALAGFFGGEDAADRAVAQLFETLPKEVADAFAPAVRSVLGHTRGDILTLGFLLALFISSSGVESLRTALNRAYRVKENRSFWQCRLQSFAFVLGGAVAMLIVGFSIVLAPAIQAFAGDHFKRLGPIIGWLDQLRLLIGSLALFIMLFAMHFWLPAGHRRLVDIWPGVLHTVVLWLIAGVAYSNYLAYYNYYTSMYAGLANIMIALFFFYITAVIFVFGAELNRAIIEEQ